MKMKTTIKLILLLTILSYSSCNEKSKTKTFLAKYVDSLKVQHSLGENPMILFDGVPIGYENMNDGWFSIKEEEVHEIEYVKKGQTKIYGNKDEFGVILLYTRESMLKKLDESWIHEIKRIYVLNAKVVSKAFIQDLDRDEILDVSIFRDQNKISEFTSENFDEMVKVITK